MRRPLAALLVLVTSLALVGCVGMPNDGPVVTTRAQGDPVSAQGAAFIDPLPPQPGWSRTEVARGFVNAMQKWPLDLATAKEYLTTDAAAAWNPQHQTITYGAPPTPRDVGGEVTVRLTTANHLDARGAWQGALPPRQRTVTLSMVRADGEWRIDDAPNALIVPENWFADRYRPVSLYFFDPTASILEPEPVFVPTGDQLATSLTEALLMGPGSGLQRVAQTFIPRGLDVAVGVTVSDEGVADVLLTGDAGQLSANTVDLMMAQFAWTLRQEPKVKSIRLSVGGAPVPLPGGVSSYRVDGGAEYDPAGFQSSPLLYGLSRAGRLVSGTPAALGRVDGPFGNRSYDLRSVGVDLGANRSAGVTEGGTTVLAAPLADAGAGKVRTVATGTDFLRPAWDFSDRMWLVDRTARGARVFHVDPGAAGAVPLRIPGLTGERVRMFLVSRDSTRLVAVVRRAGRDVLMMSRIEHNGAGDVLGALPAQPITVGDDVSLPVRDISWRTSASLAVLNPLTPTRSEVAPASVDGAPIGPDATATDVEGRVLGLAGSPVGDEPIYGTTRRGLVVVSADPHSITFDDPIRAIVYVG
ncbi:LpqB family beta-propeller domain-containing protein [Nocardioides sp. HB32]